MPKMALPVRDVGEVDDRDVLADVAELGGGLKRRHPSCRGRLALAASAASFAVTQLAAGFRVHHLVILRAALARAARPTASRRPRSSIKRAVAPASRNGI